MAISLVPKTLPETIKLVSIQDAAIDWDLSYVELTEEDIKDEDDNLEKLKMRKHREENDVAKLVFKPDEAPTIFCFHNPKKLEWSKKITSLELNVQSMSKKAQPCDLWFEAFDMLLIGTAENFTEDPTYIPRDKHTKKIEGSIMQALVQQSVVMELGTILLSKTHESNVSERQKK